MGALPNLDGLHRRHPGLTEAVCCSFAEAAGVCFSRHHQPPATLDVHNRAARTPRQIHWQPPDERTARAWANQDDATRDGAYSVSLATIEVEHGLVAVGRAETRTVAEWTGRHPFRQRGRPSAEVFHALQLRATQPAAGSYRFTVRFVEPAQRDLFEVRDSPPIRPGAVAESTIRILKLLNTAAVEELQEYIPEEDYRRAFTQLARNLAPTKRDAREIEVRQRSGRPDETEESVVLVMGSRAAINEVVRSSLEEDTEVTQVRGVLRALDLDRQWVDIQPDEEGRKRCVTPPEFLDDVVGPMVNRQVIAHGKTRRGKFHLRDIELDEEGDS